MLCTKWIHAKWLTQVEIVQKLKFQITSNFFREATKLVSSDPWITKGTNYGKFPTHLVQRLTFSLSYLYQVIWEGKVYYLVRLCYANLLRHCLCSSDQVRSLSSTMHDTKGNFQFFAVDFANDPTIFHSGFILNQAVFVNFAIRQIMHMYNDGEMLIESPSHYLILNRIVRSREKAYDCGALRGRNRCTCRCAFKQSSEELPH
jgi:hypothetical protein